MFRTSEFHVFFKSLDLNIPYKQFNPTSYISVYVHISTFAFFGHVYVYNC